tara:strand:- start:1197 stop:1445 length:249 start_codon:yes stop_codon:yes gene_type:complete
LEAAGVLRYAELGRLLIAFGRSSAGLLFLQGLWLPSYLVSERSSAAAQRTREDAFLQDYAGGAGAGVSTAISHSSSVNLDLA